MAPVFFRFSSRVCFPDALTRVGMGGIPCGPNAVPGGPGKEAGSGFDMTSGRKWLRLVIILTPVAGARDVACASGQGPTFSESTAREPGSVVEHGADPGAGGNPFGTTRGPTRRSSAAGPGRRSRGSPARSPRPAAPGHRLPARGDRPPGPPEDHRRPALRPARRPRRGRGGRAARRPDARRGDRPARPREPRPAALQLGDPRGPGRRPDRQPPRQPGPLRRRPARPLRQLHQGRPGGPTQYDVNISYPVDYSGKRQARTAAARAAAERPGGRSTRTPSGSRSTTSTRPSSTSWRRARRSATRGPAATGLERLLSDQRDALPRRPDVTRADVDRRRAQLRRGASWRSSTPRRPTGGPGGPSGRS